MTDGDQEEEPPFSVNGWTLYAHPLFLDQIDTLIDEIKSRKRRHPKTWHKKNAAKRLKAILRLVFEIVPADTASPIFRQGDTLGSERKHWFRAKFFQQYRLFFRFDSQARVIVFAWVNDTESKRAYGSKTDAYATFRHMLNAGRPPDDFEVLKAEAEATSKRFNASINASPTQED